MFKALNVCVYRDEAKMKRKQTWNFWNIEKIYNILSKELSVILLQRKKRNKIQLN